MKSFAIVSTFAVAVSAAAQSTYVPPVEELTTSTVYKTHEVTVTSCAPTVTDCPAKHTPYVTTVTEVDYTTVCPKESKTKTTVYPTHPVEHPTYPVETPKTKTYPVETPKTKTKTYPVETPKTETKTKTYPVATYPVETPKTETKTYPVETPKTETKTYPVETPVTISTISYSTSCPPKPTDETVTRPVESSTYTPQPPKYTVTYSQGGKPPGSPYPSGTGVATYPVASPSTYPVPGQSTYPVPGQSQYPGKPGQPGATYPVASGQPPKPTEVYPSQYPIATGAAGKVGVSAFVGLGAFAALFL